MLISVSDTVGRDMQYCPGYKQMCSGYEYTCGSFALRKNIDVSKSGDASVTHGIVF